MTDKSVIDTIIAEAGGSEAGMRAVAAVIANRAAQTGLTPAQVVKQAGQFEGYSNPGRGSREAMKVGRLRDMAERAFTDISTGKVADPTHGSTSFRTAGTKIHAPHGTVEIAGNVFAKGSKALDAINAAAPSPQSRPNALAYAPPSGNLSATNGNISAPPRLSNAAMNGVRLPPSPQKVKAIDAQATPSLDAMTQAILQAGAGSGVVNPSLQRMLAQQVPPAFRPSASGGMSASAAGNGSSALMPPLPRGRPSAPLTSRSVQTVHIGPDGNPISDLQFALDNYAANRADPSNPANAPKVAAVPKAPTPLTGSYVQGPILPGQLRPKVSIPPSAPILTASASGSGGFSSSGNGSGSMSLPTRVASIPTPAQRNANDIVVSRPLPVATPPRTLDATNPIDGYRLGLTTSPAPAPQTPAVQAITHQIVNPAYTAWVASQTQPLKAGQAYTAGGSVVDQSMQNAFGGLSSYPVAPPKVSTPAPSKYITVQAPTVPQAVDPWASVRYGIPAVPTPGMVTGPIAPSAAPHPGGLLGMFSGLFGGGAPSAPYYKSDDEMLAKLGDMHKKGLVNEDSTKAVLAGRGAYTVGKSQSGNSDNALMPTRTISGALRNTYGD